MYINGVLRLRYLNLKQDVCFFDFDFEDVMQVYSSSVASVLEIHNIQSCIFLPKVKSYSDMSSLVNKIIHPEFNIDLIVSRLCIFVSTEGRLHMATIQHLVLAPINI